MKLSIEKLPTSGQVEVQLTPEGARKPVVITLPAAQVDVLIAMLTAAKNADVFRFSLEV
jgi:hypothetical protein